VVERSALAAALAGVKPPCRSPRKPTRMSDRPEESGEPKWCFGVYDAHLPSGQVHVKRTIYLHDELAHDMCTCNPTKLREDFDTGSDAYCITF